MFFFFNYSATTEIYTLSLHDALPISPRDQGSQGRPRPLRRRDVAAAVGPAHAEGALRSEEHTSELQSLRHLVCRLLLEKKKKKNKHMKKMQGMNNISYSGKLHAR